MTLKKLPDMTRRSFLALFVIALCAAMITVNSSAAKAEKPPKPEDVVERTILLYGSRSAIYGIQRNGILRALIKFISPDGNREGKSAVKFIRKQKLNEDLLMIDLDLPGAKYMIGFDGKEMWSISDGEIRKPGADEIKAFRSGHEHSYEALLRYKENNGKLEYVGTNKLGTLDLDIIDLILPDGIRTRYEISRRTGRILYLNYEDKPDPNAEGIKYRLYFKDFRIIQNSVIPYETQVFQNGKLVEERKIVEAAFNVQLEEKAFKAENANKPAEPAPGS